MRVAANEVERTLAAAAAEARHVAPSQREERTQELVEALNRAAELRRKPFGKALVRGRKDGVVREVITTGFTRGAYRLCLVPYSEAQERCRRRTAGTYYFRRPGGRWLGHVPPRNPGKRLEEDALEVRALLPYHAHEQWIAERRLERGEV